MNHRRVLLATVFGVLVPLVTAAWAHHSQSEFDSRAKVEVQGAVTKVDWRSPHVWIYIDVADDKGQKVNWSFELPSPNTLMRRGWTRDSLKPGDLVKVTGSPARNHAAIAIATSIKDNSGKAMFTGVTQIYEPEAEPKPQK